jgi:formylglycine-generating enzyme required for sulfatase activity
MRRMLIAVFAAAAAVACAPAWLADAASASVLATARDCEACPEMAAIPGGEFTMGSPAGDSEGSDNERPQRVVRVKPFALGKPK